MYFHTLHMVEVIMRFSHLLGPCEFLFTIFWISFCWYSTLTQKSESLNSSPSASFDTEENPNAGAIVPYEPVGEFKGGPGRKSFSRRVEELSGIDAFPEPTQAGDLFSATVRGRRPPPVQASPFKSFIRAFDNYLSCGTLSNGSVEILVS